MPWSALLFVALLQDPLAIPDPGRVVARSAFGEVRAEEFYREVAAAHGRDRRWRPVLEQLIQVEITRQELARAGLAVAAAQVDERLAREREKAKAQGQSLEELLAGSGGVTPELLRYYMEIALAQELLAARALGLPPEAVTRSQADLWLKETAAAYKDRIEERLDNLEGGVVAVVAGKAIPAEAMGWVLTAALAKERPDFLKQVATTLVTGRRIRQLAQEAGLKATPEDEEEEIGRRRRNVQSDPLYRGQLTLDRILEDRGLSVAILRRTRSFHDFLLLQKLMERRFPREEQLARLARNRQGYLDRFGERRHLWHIALQPRPGQEELARKEAEALKERLHGLSSFRYYALRHSTDRESRARGGDLGWVARAQPGLPEPILEAAFALAPDQVGGPVAAGGHLHLLLVSEVQPAPPDEELLGHVQADLRNLLLKELLGAAKIEIP